MLRRVDTDHAVYHAKPVFAVGGTVSGYGSLGSAESLTTAAADKSVTNSDSSSGKVTQVQSMPPPRSAFKSTFAKELHQENVQKNSPSWRNSSYRSSFIDEVIREGFNK